MRHSLRATADAIGLSLALALALATGGCNDERAPEGAPAAVEPAPAVAEAHEGVIAPNGEHADRSGGGLFLRRVEEPSAPSHPGGLTGLTRELVDKARHTLGDPLRLVPDAAQYVARARPAAILAHPEAQAAWAKGEEADPSFKIAMDVARTCLGRLEALDDVVLGVDDARHLVLIVHAKGLGTDATWRCLQTQTLARGRPFDLATTGSARGSGPQLRTDDGVGWFPDDDTVVLASSDWVAEVEARMRGEGMAAVDGRLAAAMTRVQVDDPLWLAGRVGEAGASLLTGSAIPHVDDLALDFRLAGEDLVIAGSLDVGEPADAARIRTDVQLQVDQFKSMLPLLGFPATVGPKLAFTADGDLLKLDLVLTVDELRGLREGIERSF